MAKLIYRRGVRESRWKRLLQLGLTEHQVRNLGVICSIARKVNQDARKAKRAGQRAASEDLNPGEVRKALKPLQIAAEQLVKALESAPHEVVRQVLSTSEKGEPAFGTLYLRARALADACAKRAADLTSKRGPRVDRLRPSLLRLIDAELPASIGRSVSKGFAGGTPSPFLEICNACFSAVGFASAERAARAHIARRESLQPTRSRP